MLRLSANLSTLFGELSFLERFGAARRAGFAAGEFQYGYDHDLADVREALAEAGLPLVLINTPRGSRPNDRGLAAIPGREAEFREGMEQALEWSRTLGNRFIHVMSGAPGDGDTRDACVEVWRGNMAWAVAQAREAGVELLIEALNPVDVPGYFVRSLDDAVDLLEMIGTQGAGLLFDVYHCARSGEPVVPAMKACAGWIRHIQIADSPSRGEPGTGDVDWASVFEAIEASGYRGYLGAEYIPRNGTLEGLAWAKPYLEQS
jgi:Hydroxypyruvate isomerase